MPTLPPISFAVPRPSIISWLYPSVCFRSPEYKENAYEIPPHACIHMPRHNPSHRSLSTLFTLEGHIVSPPPAEISIPYSTDKWSLTNHKKCNYSVRATRIENLTLQLNVGSMLRVFRSWRALLVWIKEKGKQFKAVTQYSTKKCRTKLSGSGRMIDWASEIDNCCKSGRIKRCRRNYHAGRGLAMAPGLHRRVSTKKAMFPWAFPTLRTVLELVTEMLTLNSYLGTPNYSIAITLST